MSIDPTPFLVYASLGLAWLIVAGLGAADLARGLFRGERRWVLTLLAVFAGALLVRLLFATWGPGDDQYRHLEFLDREKLAIFHPRLDHHLGSAPAALWGLLFTVVPFSASAIVAVSLLFGSLSTVLLALFLREAGAPRAASVSAAVLLAVQPLAVRFSGDMSRASHVMLLATLALWALARHRRRRGVTDLVLFASSAWLCCRTRPEAGMIVALAGFLVAFVHLSQRSLRERWLHAQIAVLLVVGLAGVGSLAYASEHVASVGRELSLIQQMGGFASFGALTWFDLDYTSPVAMLLALLGVALVFWRRDRVALWALASTVLMVFVLPYGQTSGLRVAYARYQGLVFLSLSVLSGCGVQMAAALARRFGGRAARWATVSALAVALVATSLAPLRAVCAPFTIDLEYDFLHQALDRLPPNARIYSPIEPLVDHVGGFRNANTIFGLAGREPWRPWPLPDAPPADRPTYVYRAPACYVVPELLRTQYTTAAPLLDRCAEALGRTTADGALTTPMPARPFANEEWTATELTIGFFPLR